MKKHRSGRGILFAAILLLSLYKVADAKVDARQASPAVASVVNTISLAVSGNAR